MLKIYIVNVLFTKYTCMRHLCIYFHISSIWVKIRLLKVWLGWLVGQTNSFVTPNLSWGCDNIVLVFSVQFKVLSGMTFQLVIAWFQHNTTVFPLYRAWIVVSLPGNALQKPNLPASISHLIVTVSLFRDINYINDSCLRCK
jgi:hypothetical protein